MNRDYDRAKPDDARNLRVRAVRPEWIIGTLVAVLLVGAVAWLLTTPRGHDLRIEARRQGKKLGRQSRHTLAGALERSREELDTLREEGRDRMGDLKHQARILRKKAHVADLQKRLDHAR